MDIYGSFLCKTARRLMAQKPWMPNASTVDWCKWIPCETESIILGNLFHKLFGGIRNQFSKQDF